MNSLALLPKITEASKLKPLPPLFDCQPQCSQINTNILGEIGFSQDKDNFRSNGPFKAGIFIFLPTFNLIISTMVVEYTQEKVLYPKQIELNFKLTMDAAFHHAQALKPYQISLVNFIQDNTCMQQELFQY
jgi:hypothetical protein